MKKLLREPLLHFLLIGAALFLVAGLRRGAPPIQLGGSQAQSEKISITQGDEESLIAGFTTLWNRPPTVQELDALIQGRIREEVYYREALKMGLDRDDAIIRGRLQEKLEFLTQDVNAPTKPTEQDLESFLASNASKFRGDDLFSFRLVFVDAGLHGAATVQDAQILLTKLAQDPGINWAATGDPVSFPRSFKRAAESDVRKRLGAEFASALEAMQPRRWSGPVKTEDGAYLVHLEARVEGQLPPLDQIRPEVEKEWQAAQRQNANEAFYQTLLRRYTVTVAPSPAIRAANGIAPPKE